MNICHQRHIHLPDNIAKIQCRIHIRHRQAHNIAARSLQGIDLRHGSLRISSLSIGHGLHRNRRTVPDRNIANIYPARFLPFYHVPQPHFIRSLNVVNIIRDTSRVTPAACI